MNLPNFIFIGASKTGSTSLYHYLKQHPQIYMCTPKEPRFFIYENGKPDLAWLAGLNNTTTLIDYQALFEGVSNEKAIGEASVCYLYSPRAAQRIRAYLPNIKLIAMLRHPVERAYSHFCMKLGRGMGDHLEFAQSMRISQNEVKVPTILPYREMGFYYEQLKRYFERFDSSQIKVYLYRDYQNDVLTILRDMFRFLEVDEAFTPDRSKRYNTYAGIPNNQTLHAFFFRNNVVNRFIKPFLPFELRWFLREKFIRFNVQPIPPLSLALRQELTEIYRDDILKVQDLLKYDLSFWLE